MSSLSVEGLDNLKRMMSEFPEKGYKKPVMAAFRKAAVPVKRAMVNELPDNLKVLKRAIKVSASKGREPQLLVGVFAGTGLYRNSRGIGWDPYQIALWHNYGTLANRANRFHNFKKAVRTKRPKQGWEPGQAMAGGLRAKLFIERAWEKSRREAQAVFERVAENEIDKFFETNALK
jgi:hypothetical protein